MPIEGLTCPKPSGSCCLLWAIHTTNLAVTRCEEPVSQVKQGSTCVEMGSSLPQLWPLTGACFSPYVSHLISFPRQHSLNLKYQGNEATALLDAITTCVPSLVLIGRERTFETINTGSRSMYRNYKVLGRGGESYRVRD